ncbi:RnfABCDGE type electron transport complex subunit D [Sporolactobacillus laevolacticus]|uniref:RnfABCDGE type electron transport complex subunit D n=1 Tax=Sporolactobacillus laevolacticus TaxID=33018 RepID=UPI0025B2BB68|nr:RnfABCDGE type electron transport complex subunit D [Sporolactobacillus laevolacticus]MDN3953584.1 RnfABCDGE type electron transport complex subunit D [Sporolactobacillus laevolacticus]
MERINTAQETVSNNTESRKKGTSSKKKTGIQKYVRMPKGIVLFILVILAVTGLSYTGGSGGIKNVLLAVGTGLIVDFVVTYITGRPLKISDGAIITALIIGVILSPTTSWYNVIFTTVIGLLSKHLLKDKRKPWLNPAAFGLLISATLFSTGESWWGGLSMLPAWMTILLLISGFIIVDRINKFPLILSFFSVYMLFFLIVGILNIASVSDAFRMPYINAALFLGFFMLTDPPTSPAKYRDQVLFGIIAGVVSGLSFLYISKLSYLLFGVLIANLWKVVQSKYFNTNRAKDSRIGNVQNKRITSE